MINLKARRQYSVIVDDTILCLKELTEGNYLSIFDEPILKYYKTLHDAYNAHFNLSLFYRDYNSTFDLSQCTDVHKSEFQANSDWLNFSFHCWDYPTRYWAETKTRNMSDDYFIVKNQVERFAGLECWTLNTIIHFYSGNKIDMETISTQEVGDRLWYSTSLHRSSEYIPPWGADCHYLDDITRSRLVMHGSYLDVANNILFVSRPFYVEAIVGAGRLGYPMTMTAYLNDVFSKKGLPWQRFFTITTHEVYMQPEQIIYREGMTDACIWAKNKNYVGRFPSRSDFNLKLNWDILPMW